jgi:thiamine pyrophosphate-dependent acetolactate synthase large subunit-like protein
MLAVEAIALELQRRGVKYIFGIPGKESLRLGVELERLGVTFVSARHETQAVMMADGYWRASGQLGVALVAQGAGLANAVGGMACVARARSGVVVISGDLLRSDAGTDRKARSLQDLKGVDPRKLCDSVNIAYVRPSSGETILAEIRAALELAQSGCAVSLNIPSDLFSVRVTDAREDDGVRPPGAKARPVDPADIAAVADLLGTGWTAGRPIIVAGRGAVRSGAVPVLRRLAELTGSLLATSLLARSAFRGDSFDIGVCGTFSSPVATRLLSQSDCVLVFGASLNPFTTYGGSIFSKKAHLIHVDRDADALGKYVAPELAVRADARAFADALVAELERRDHRSVGLRTPEIAREIASYDARAEFTDESRDGFIDPRTLMSELNELLPKSRLLVVDAGLHLHNACVFLDVERPEDFIFPIDSLAVGLGMGAAIGAAAACPDRTIVLEVGDCGFMMSLGDLETAVRLTLPIIIVVCNDQAWGAEAQHLRMLGLPDAFVRMHTPSLAAVAKAMGAEGFTVTSTAELRALADTLRRPLRGPIVLDCRVDPDIQPESFNFDYAGVFAK